VVENLLTVSIWAEDPFWYAVSARWPFPSSAAFAALLVVGVLPPQPLFPADVHLVGSGGAPAGPLNSSDHTRRVYGFAARGAGGGAGAAVAAGVGVVGALVVVVVALWGSGFVAPVVGGFLRMSRPS
jgi:hypothetical protein